MFNILHVHLCIAHEEVNFFKLYLTWLDKESYFIHWGYHTDYLSLELDKNPNNKC